MKDTELIKLAQQQMTLFFNKRIVAQKDIELLNIQYGEGMIQYMIFRVNSSHNKWIEYSGYKNDVYIYYWDEMRWSYSIARLSFIVKFGYFNSYLEEEHAKRLLKLYKEVSEE